MMIKIKKKKYENEFKSATYQVQNKNKIHKSLMLGTKYFQQCLE